MDGSQYSLLLPKTKQFPLCLFTSWVKVIFHLPQLLSFPFSFPFSFLFPFSFPFSFLSLSFLFPFSFLPGTSPVHTCRQGPWSTLEICFSCVDSCRRPTPTTVRQQTASSPTRTFCGWEHRTRARVWRQSSWRSVRRCWDRRHRAPLCPRWGMHPKRLPLKARLLHVCPSNHCFFNLLITIKFV